MTKPASEKIVHFGKGQTETTLTLAPAGFTLDEIERRYRDCRLPLVVGGTGLYVRTLLKGLCAAPPADPIVRATLRQEAKAEEQPEGATA